MLGTVMLVACSWAHPGLDPYTGTTADAVNGFTIPRAHRAVIIEKIESGRPDDDLFITRDSVFSNRERFNDFLLMYFGANKLCWGVDRKAWRGDAVQHGYVYCSGEYCVAKPDVCGNITQLFGRNKRDIGDPVPEPEEATHAVPEPGTLALLLVAAIVGSLRLYRKR